MNVLRRHVEQILAQHHEVGPLTHLDGADVAVQPELVRRVQGSFQLLSTLQPLN